MPSAIYCYLRSTAICDLLLSAILCYLQLSIYCEVFRSRVTVSTVEAPGRSKLLRWGHELRLSCIPSVSAEFERSECVCVTCGPPASHPAPPSPTSFPATLVLCLRLLPPPPPYFLSLPVVSSSATLSPPRNAVSPPFRGARYFQNRVQRVLWRYGRFFPFPSAASLSCLQRFNAFSSQPACQPAICLAHIPPTLSRFPLIALLHTPAPLHASPTPDHGPCSCGLSILPSSISLTGPRVM